MSQGNFTFFFIIGNYKRQLCLTGATTELHGDLDNRQIKELKKTKARRRLMIYSEFSTLTTLPRMRVAKEQTKNPDGSILWETVIPDGKNDDRWYIGVNWDTK